MKTYYDKDTNLANLNLNRKGKNLWWPLKSNGLKVKKICKKFNPVILDKTKKSIVIQVTALRAEIDKLALDLKSLGLISTSRTGAVAMTKGPRIFN